MKHIGLSLILLAVLLVLAGCADNTGIQHSVKQEIVVACGKDATGTLTKVMQDFNSQSETTRVKLLEFPNESVELHRVISSMLAGQEVQFDAMLIEDVWVEEFMKNDYLLPLCGTEEFHGDEYPAGIDKFIGDNKNVYWYPIILDTGVMYYRKDLVGGSKRLDVIAQGEGEPYAIQGADGEEMLACALEFINLKGSVEEGIALYKEALDNPSCKAVNYLAEFKDGNAVYMRAWSSNSRSIMQGFSTVSGLVGADVMTKSDGSSYSMARAYGYSVNRHSVNKEGCMELLEYFKSDEVQMQLLKGMGTLPIKREHYQNPIILDYTDYAEDAADFVDSFVFRPRRPDYTFVSREARAAIKAYIQDKGSLEEATAAVEKLFSTAQ